MTGWSATETWKRLRTLSERLLPCLEMWWKDKDQILEKQVSSARKRIVSRWHGRAEDLVAMEVVLGTRDVLRRIVRMLGFVVLAQALLLGSHVFFPFQQRHLSIAVDWSYLALAIGAALAVFAQMDRQEILCRVASEGDRTRWSGDFALKILLYAILPLLGLFAA